MSWMQQNQQSKLQWMASYLSEKTSSFIQYCRNTSQPHLDTAIQKVQPLYNSSRQFYQQHKSAILVITTALIAYAVLRPRRKREDEKNKKKRSSTIKKQLGNKTFVSDESIQEYKEEPSTSIRVESSGREAAPRKKVPERMLERIQSSSEEQETGDKIFFEMYKQYQAS